MGAGIFVSSRTFRAGGRGWSIMVYPDGLKEGDKAEYVSVFLCLIDGPKDAKTSTKYSLELLLPKDGRVSELTRYSAVTISHSFNVVISIWGRVKFVEKSKLKPLLGPNLDCFTVRCASTVIGESQSEDVAELLGPMKEKAIEVPIKVADMDSSIFEELLHFIYTDSLSDSKKDGDDKNISTQHLLVAADRYGIDRLRQMCEVSLCQGLDEQTVATTLALAEQHHCARLKDACLKFVASRRGVLGVVMKTDGLKYLVASCPLIVVEILDRIIEA